MNTNVTQGELLERLDIDLPALPHTFLMAMGLSREADRISIDEVVEIIQNDPGIVARVLRTVNSAYYGMRREITSIHRAVIALGPQAVLGIVMSLSLVDVKKHMHITSSNTFQRLVQHCIAVGYLAGKIVSMSRLTEEILAEEHDFPNEAFMLGLLHDFGKMVLYYNFPDEAIPFYDTIRIEGEYGQSLLIEEREVFGVDHVVAGKYLMQELNFLSTMESAVGLHHSYDGTGSHTPAVQYLLNVVVASNMLANTIGLYFNHKMTRNQFIEHSLWDRMIEQQIFDVTDKEVLFDKLFALEERARAYVSEVI